MEPLISRRGGTDGHQPFGLREEARKDIPPTRAEVLWPLAAGLHRGDLDSARRFTRSSPAMSRILMTLTLAAAFMSGGCSVFSSQPRTDHVAFKLRDNLLVIPATVGGHSGEFILGTAQSHSTVDSRFPVESQRSGRVPVLLGSHVQLETSVERASMSSVADGILGSGAFADRTLGIDFRRGLITLSRDRVPTEGAAKNRFEGIPAIPISIDGTSFTALIDTTNPDTILLPEAVFGLAGRRPVSLRIGSFDMGTTDARVGPVSDIRIGNRILEKFFVSIDYDRGEVSLWPWDIASASARAKSSNVSMSRIGRGGAIGLAF